MLTQNLFNKKPKTFMDYEPGKLPSNKDWDTQMKSETKNYAPFASNVKIVGDNVTKKDYDDFFEGFNDPYGEKREQEQQRKERLANIRANADNRTWSSQNTDNPFLEGFNGILSEREQKEKFPSTRFQAKPQNAYLKFPNTNLHASTKNDASLERFSNPNGQKNIVGEVASEWGENIGAHMGLHNTAHDQYPWMRIAGLLSPVAISGRITSSSAKVPKYKDIINDVSNRYNVPSEIIGGIIFKEQLTKSLPDTLGNIHTSITKDSHSTGLGAIFPATARAAWGEVDSQKELPKTNEELQYKLTHDKQFNIETIAAVLLYEARNEGLISDVSEASNLTTEQWWKAVAKYNGSDEYARKVYEYLPYITELLD